MANLHAWNQPHSSMKIRNIPIKKTASSLQEVGGENESKVNRREATLSTMEGELRRVRSAFVQRVSITVVKGLLDDLWQQKVFSTEDMDSVMQEHKIRADRARCLIDMVMGKGERASRIMIDCMKKKDHDLCSTLGLISSPAGVGNKGRKRKRSESEEKVTNKEPCTVDGSGSNTETRSAGQALTDKELLKVAQTLGQEWEQAALHLELKTKDLDDIRAEQRSVAMQKQKMLVLWKRRRPPGEATAQDLLKGLDDLEDLPVETRQLLKDMMKESSG